ncbi:hypothetical protein CLCR_02695 [Cladophialophora carrionii]|uniref:Uncharacterized protein n=1 Tax=Cladophialophora carrionii TaxID=86049 RepID=A0A1C1CF57_9EURO|nr:hypothetical protein CLCR_02695 [Cladophialophora carrionii]
MWFPNTMEGHLTQVVTDLGGFIHLASVHEILEDRIFRVDLGVIVPERLDSLGVTARDLTAVLDMALFLSRQGCALNVSEDGTI